MPPALLLDIALGDQLVEQADGSGGTDAKALADIGIGLCPFDIEKFDDLQLLKEFLSFNVIELLYISVFQGEDIHQGGENL